MSDLASQFSVAYKVINKVHFREFDDEIAETVLGFYQRLVLASVQLDPILYFEITNLPYRLMLEVEGYRSAGSRPASRYSGDQEIKRIELLAGLVFRVLQGKAMGREVIFNWPEESDHLARQFDWDD